MTSGIRHRLFALAAAAALAGCSGTAAPSARTAATPPGDPGAAQTVEVTIAPEQAAIVAGQTISFSATVTGSADAGVAWSVDESLGGTITTEGVYTAPSKPGTYHVTVTSRADGAKSKKARIIVEPSGTVTVAVSPATPSLGACQTVQLAATVSGAADPTVSWAVAEGAAGGTVSATGLYRAPAATGTFHVVATSLADATRTSTATVTVGDAAILSVVVTPGTVSLAPGQSAQLTARVTTSCGTYDQAGTLLANGAILPD